MKIRTLNWGENLFDDDRTRWRDDDVDEIEIAVPNFFNFEVINFIPELGSQRWCGFDVFSQRLLIKYPETLHRHVSDRTGGNDGGRRRLLW